MTSLKEVPFRHFKDITFGFTPDLSKWCTSCVPSFFSKSWPIAKFVMPPSNYLTINGNNADIICLALFADETYTFQTFGAYALKGLVFVVDNEMNRIGWRRSNDCQ
ncbi:hypothetical protein M758_7G156000 [Ceratodon purpureus]|nr:hypothetical protein M758_7G156000 [Ceratodon purpureus]